MIQKSYSEKVEVLLKLTIFSHILIYQKVKLVVETVSSSLHANKLTRNFQFLS